MTNGEPAVTARTVEAVTTITLNRPEKLNALTSSSYEQLAGLLRKASTESNARVVVLEGAGRAFCSGVDLDSAANDSEREPLSEAFKDLIEALITMEKPLVAAVHGAAVGFGATILLHCDVVLVAEDTRLRYPFTILGTPPEAGSSFLLPLTVGLQRAAKLILTARWITAPEAVRYGLAARMVPAADLQREAARTAEAIASAAPEALVCAKRLLRGRRAEAVRAALTREFEEAAILPDALGPIGGGAGT